MPRNNPFRFLKNPISDKEKFNKQRGFPQPNQEEEYEALKLPTKDHQDRLFTSSRLLAVDRRQRRAARTNALPDTIEIIRIHFFTRFNRDLENKFRKLYGLSIISYEGFNKTVLFSIDDEQLFNVFGQHITDFHSSPNNVSYEGQPYALIALIQDFHFLSSEKRKLSFSSAISSFSLIPFVDRRATRILGALTDFLKRENKMYSINEFSTNLEVSELSAPEFQEILDNFDIIHSVTSSRAARIRPGDYGTAIRDYDFTVIADNTNITVGVIDTGVEAIVPLRPALAGISADLTGSGTPNWDESGHGTMVAGLIALGPEFLETRKETYKLKANIAIIKVLQANNDNYSINSLTATIKNFRRDHNIRFFNLSLNDPMPKGYNSPFSDYAYLLDKLAFDEDLIIFISTGNILAERVEELQDEEHPSHKYPYHFYCPDRPSGIHHCETTNICAPAESLNNLTIGALADNYEGNFAIGITPAKEYPAYYTRKFHYDYNQEINGTVFSRSQKNKHLNKPDLVFNGGDLLDFSAGIEVLTSPQTPTNRYFSRSAGTSIATPLVTSMAAQIAQKYPSLKTQTIKAILLNTCELRCTQSPPHFRDSSLRHLLGKLSGKGSPVNDYTLQNDENEITLVLEEEIDLEEIKCIKLDLPPGIARGGNKLEFTATLCYSFNPLRGNHLNYCPLQIVFGFFKNVTIEQLANGKVEDYKITNGPTWSDDIWPVENRLYSNVQHLHFYLDGKKLVGVQNSITLAIRCTGKKEIDPAYRAFLEASTHPFSLVINISEVPEARASGILYDEMINLNTLELITTAELDADLNLEA